MESDWSGAVNHGLLCVKGRFEPLFDGRKRVTTPMVRKNGQLQPATWDEALQAAADGLKGMNGSLGAVISSRVTNETAAAVCQDVRHRGEGRQHVTRLSFTVMQAGGRPGRARQRRSVRPVGGDLPKD